MQGEVRRLLSGHAELWELVMTGGLWRVTGKEIRDAAEGDLTFICRRGKPSISCLSRRVRSTVPQGRVQTCDVVSGRHLAA